MRILSFGIAREIIGESELAMALAESITVSDLKAYLEETYPDFKTLPSYRVAINQTFAEDDDEIAAHDEVAIIPPVSGG